MPETNQTSRQTTVQMTPAQLEALVERSVERVLVRSGLSTEDAIKNQADFRFLRTMRTTHEAVKSKAILTIISTVIVGAITLIVMGFAQWVNHGTPGK